MATVDDVHPSVDEIQPYVSIGPSQNLSVTLDKETFDTGFITFTILFGLILLILVGVTIFFAYQQANLPPPPEPLRPIKQDLTIHSNIGAAVASTSVIGKNEGFELTTKEQCATLINTIWTGDVCQCKPPFFGPNCLREKHNNRYYAVGIPNEETLNISIIDEFIANGKSFSEPDSNILTNFTSSLDFNPKSCSDNCNINTDCIGFIYHPVTSLHNELTGNYGVCTLLKENVIIPSGSSISYSTDIDSTLYMKSSDNLQFSDKIFLGEFIGTFPPRYWLVRDTPSYKQLIPNEITTLTFAPTYTKIFGIYTGIYCLHPFSHNDIDIILDRGSTSECYIHHSGSDINLPPDWKYKLPLYVTYI